MAEALRIVRSCSYPGGRDLDKLRGMAEGEMDDVLEDAELAAAVREAAGVELFGRIVDGQHEDSGGPEGGFPGHPEDW